MMAGTDNKLIKKAHTKQKYTNQQLDELQKCMDPDTGPLYFIENFVYIQHPTQGRIRFTPFPYQRELIRVYHEYRNSVSMLSRQLGKSTAAQAYLLWYAMFVPDSTVLVAAHKYKGSQEIMQRLRYAYESCPDHIRCGVVSYNKGSIEFDNGSRIESTTTTENTGRGMSISLLYLDEFAFVRPSIAKEFWTAITPTLATGGKCLITSTPNNDDDQFAHIWRLANRTTDEFGNETDIGTNGFKAFMALWSEHPDRDEAWAAESRANLGEEKFRREMDCEFIIDDETLINQLLLAEIETIDPIEKQGQIRWFKKPKPNNMYLASLDPSMGTGGDASAIQVFELPSMEQVAEWQHNKTPIEGQMKVMMSILKEIQYTMIGKRDVVDTSNLDIFWTVESNTLGEAALVVIRETGEENFPGMFISEPSGPAAKKRKGMLTTNRSKLEACGKLKSFIESRKMKINSKNLLRELKTYIAKGNTYCAKQGEHDDLVSSTLLVVRMIQYISQWDDKVFNRVNSNILSGSTGGYDDDDDAPMPIVF